MFAFKAKPKPVKKEVEQGQYLGEITHFFSRIKVVVIKIEKGKLQVGDRIHIKGGSTDFKQEVKSIQIESVDVKAAKKGDDFGLKVDKKARVGDKVYRL